MPAINLISAVPNFTSPEEHRSLVASTPSSFNDIPPILRHKEDNVSVSVEPALEEFTAEDYAQGTLYVLTSVLVFMSTTGRGFQIEYPAITLHAISRGEAPSIYCQLDESVGDENAMDTQKAEEDVLDMRELSIIPRNPGSLDPIFESLSQCASLHPDKETDEDDLDDAFIDADPTAFEVFTGDEEQELSEVGRAALAHLESIIYDPHDPDSQQPNGAGQNEHSFTEEEHPGDQAAGN